MQTTDQELIARNIEVHDKVARKYDTHHGEIFNPIEQERLAASLSSALDAVTTGNKPLKALDFGCGSGNLSRHLLALGCDVVAADVSKHFLELVSGRFPADRLSTLLMNGADLSNVEDDSFDIVATYSVLHHVPDYLGAVREMARVCRPGGVVYLDHEQNEGYWAGNDPVYGRFKSEVEKFDWKKFLKPSNYVHKVRRIFDPKHTNEGDIHVWPDDHIEWPKIKAIMEERGFDAVIEEDYLLFREIYRPEVFLNYVGRCTDMRVMAFRKRP
ncbi:MAG: class I SAM-dependent methyltransferase [Alphaproteobacteria bacterium]|nr:MAG: class I SAM-dependent methyltransferase [Alphaproteobacteria bacterium]